MLTLFQNLWSRNTLINELLNAPLYPDKNNSPLKTFLKTVRIKNTIITHKLLVRTRLINRIPIEKLKHMSFLITYVENILA